MLVKTKFLCHDRVISTGKGRMKMAMPLKEGTHISVEWKNFGECYAMPSMEMATDHYSIGFIISGDRKCITPLYTYSYHGGDVALSMPYMYHRTVAESRVPYERILIKYTPEFISPFLENVGRQIFDGLYEKKMWHFSGEGQEKIKRLFLEMNEVYKKDRPYKEFILQGMLFRILTVIWEERLPEEEELFNKTPLTEPVMDAITYIENFYSKNPTLSQAARVANFSESYFSRLFQAQLGMSYTEYLDNVKLRHVKMLLAQTDKSIMEIAQETGYCHGNYLSGRFKKAVGMTPGAYRKNARGR